MTKSDLLNILYNTRISLETLLRVVDEKGVDEPGINPTVYTNHKGVHNGQDSYFNMKVLV